MAPRKPARSAPPKSAKKSARAPAVAAALPPVLPIPPPSGLTHIDPHGRVRMVDVTEKAETERSATARATLSCSAATRNAILGGDLRKGEALAAARIAGILAAKRTGELIPLCHPLSLTDVEITFLPLSKGVTIQAKATTLGRTGVEMEALVAASVAALTLYDMAKAVEREMVISNVMLMDKRGGKSGAWERPKR